LFRAVRSVFQTGNSQNVDCFEGGALTAILENGVVTIRKVGEETSASRAILRELMLLSLDIQQREAALQEVMKRLGVAIPSRFYSLGATIRSSPLGEDDIAALFQELSEGVSALQARAVESMQKGQPQLDDLVPATANYYAKFCGPLPHETKPDEYIKGTLAEYRRELLKRDLAKGLDVCVVGGLAFELSPAKWTDGVSNDDLWDAIQIINPWRDPYSLLNTFDVVLGRLADRRYDQFAREAAEKLVAPTFQCGKGHDGLELLPLLSALVLNRMNDAEDLNLCPPYWKRMCSWMHGAILLRITQDYGLNLEQLRRWVESCRSVEAVFTHYRDLRIEPMFRATEMSKDTLVAEIIGRLNQIIERTPEAAATVGLTPLVRAAQERISRNDPFGWSTPGPLEGHRIPRDKSRELAANDVAECLAMAETKAFEHMWFGLAKMSQLCDLTDAVLRKGAARTSALIGEAKPGNELRVSALVYAAIVAAAHRDVQLASVVASAACAALHKSESVEDVSAALQVILLAGAANVPESAWAVWVEEQLTNLAAAVRRGSQSIELVVLLRRLKSVLPLRYSIVDRAEAIASAAS
jgi:hypothetical protein